MHHSLFDQQVNMPFDLRIAGFTDENKRTNILMRTKEQAFSLSIEQYEPDISSSYQSNLRCPHAFDPSILEI